MLGVVCDTSVLFDSSGMNGSPYTYALRYKNACGQAATTAGTSEAYWADPGETGGGEATVTRRTRVHEVIDLTARTA